MKIFSVSQTVDNVRGMRRGFFCINRQLKS